VSHGPARRARHLAARYFGSLRARTLDDATVAWVAATLEPGEQRVWDGMGRADHAEGVAVARTFEQTGVDAAPNAGEWRAAALLHDAGKQLSGFGTSGRVFATIVAAGAGRTRARRWADGPAGWRARVGRYAAHDDLGADLLGQAGARPAVVAWARAHHRPDSWAGTGIPESVCRALADADGEP
jgi:DNA-binding protein H-NS